MGVFTKQEVLSDDPAAKKVLIAVMLLIIEVVLVAAVIPRSYTESQIAKEISLVSGMMGERHALIMQERARGWFNTAFIDSGVYDATFDFFIPNEQARRKSKGMEDLGRDNIFPYVEKTLISMWTGILQSTLRVSHYILWWPFFVLAVLPSVGDAYYQRKIKQTTFRHSSPFRYRYAVNSLTLVLTLFAMSIFLPVAIPPLTVPIGFAVIGISASFIASNLQKKM